VNPESVKLESLMDLGRQLEEVTDGATLTATLADSARGVLPFTACALCLKNRNGCWIVWRVPTGRPGAMTVVTDIPESAETVLERFLNLDQPLVIPDLLAPPWRDADHREVLWKTGTRAALLLPLIAAGKPQGVLAFTAFQPDVFRQTDVDYARFLAWVVAMTARCGIMSGGDEPLMVDDE